MKKNLVIATLLLVLLFLIVNRRSSGLCTMNALGAVTCTPAAAPTPTRRR